MDYKIDRLELPKCMDCACFNLRKAARAVTQLYDKALRPTGLRTTQFTLLVGISMLGTVTVTRLAEIGVMDRTTLTRNLKPLERNGLIQITPGNDQRTRIVTITDEGQKAVVQTLPLWNRVQADVVQRLGEERWNSLRAGLGEIVSLSRNR